MQSVAFISSISHGHIKLIFSHTNKSYIFRGQFLLLAPMTTYLKDLTQSMGRYGGLIRLQRIYNFLLFHAIIYILFWMFNGLYYTLSYYFWD